MGKGMGGVFVESSLSCILLLLLCCAMLRYIRIMSTRARSYNLWLTCFCSLSSSSIRRGWIAICAYVPAPRRLESVPGLITVTLSTTCLVISIIIDYTNYWVWGLTLTNGGSMLGVINTSGRTFHHSPSFE